MAISSLLRASLVLLAGCGWIAAAAQDAAPRPTFEVASVKPSPPLEGGPSIPGMPPGAFQDRALDNRLSNQPLGWMPMDKARVNIKRWTPAQLVAAAYKVRSDNVSGPPWMTELRFDIEAKIPDGAGTAHVNEMLQSLLEERFGLKLHKQEAEVQGYALVVAKGGPKLTPAVPKEAPASDQPMTPEQRQKMQADMKMRMADMMARMKSEGASSTSGWSRPDATMEDVANHVASITHKPVIDATEVAGKYQVSIEFALQPGDSPESGIAQAIAKLGLKLESRKVPVVTLIVDKMEKTPTEN